MRILFDMEARADAAYLPNYHDKLRGAVMNPLKDGEFTALHDNGERTGLCFSNPYPWGDMDAGDERHVLVSSPREGPLAEIAAAWLESEELNIGEMPFQVTGMRDLYPDVGEPGSRGRARTETGVYAVLPPQYDDEDTGEYETYWRPEHSLEPFQKYVEDQLQRDHEQFAPNYLPGPADVAAPLFDEWDCQKTFATPLSVTTETTLTVVLSKWEFGYEVRNDDHRRHLNLALDTGIGGRNGYGLGFLNIIEREGRTV